MDVPFFITRSSHYDPIVAVRFIVLFNAVTLGFQSVSGIGTQRSVDFISEGGRNDYPILIPKPQTEPHRLTFKRGYQMRKLSITGLLAGYTGAQAIEAQGALGLILVLDEGQSIKAIYSFISQGVVEWEVSDLDATRSTPLIETFTITHKGLKNIPVPSLF